MPWTERAVFLFLAESKEKPYGVLSAVLAKWVDYGIGSADKVN